MSNDENINDENIDVNKGVRSDAPVAYLLTEIHNSLIDIKEFLIENNNKGTENGNLLHNILEELRAGADKGEYVQQSGTVTTTTFIIIETKNSPGHPVKGYLIINDGPNPIFIAHNTIIEGLVPDTTDTATSTTRFNTLQNGEHIKITYNRKKVFNVAILASGGNSSYRVWLVW